MQWKTLALSVVLSAHDASTSPTHGLMARQFAQSSMMRFQCSQLVFDRIDPLVQPGMLPSTHMHQIVGGNAFNASMPALELDPSAQASCTTCDFSEDLSNYWTANLYFKARNGTFKRVPQMVNLGLQGREGVTVYYIPPYDGKAKVTAFPKGFRMLVGDPGLRAKEGQQKQLCHRCFSNMKQDPFGGAPCTGADTFDLPKSTCGGGIRTTITFPTCWDGKNLDSPNHKDHVAYPSSGSFESGGPCPASHPVKMPQLMYEVMWDTTPFNDKSIWPTDGSQPFVYSMGDGTGYGQHGDYLFGWKDGVLQKALDQRCMGNTCTGLKTQKAAESTKCAVSQSVREPVEGWLTELPGGPKITYK
ncbi:Nn.00g073720.m01.CDS01 [Neocucurbitaria sp. VM-36]